MYGNSVNTVERESQHGRERERERERDRQTDRQTDRETETDRQTERSNLFFCNYLIHVYIEG